MKKEKQEETRVLIADDERDVRRLVSRTVRRVRPGCKVRLAVDGRQAREKLLIWQPHLMILDLHMPHMNGIEISQFVQNNFQLTRTKIIAITAYPAPGINETFFERGVSECLFKPFDVKDLAASLRRLLP